VEGNAPKQKRLTDEGETGEGEGARKKNVEESSTVGGGVRR
jgi:hypothetical protein